MYISCFDFYKRDAKGESGDLSSALILGDEFGNIAIWTV